MKSDREKDGLFGPVRAMRIEKTILSETGGKNPEGSWVASEVAYHRKGNKSEEATYKADGSLMKRSVFDYDSAHNLTAATVYNADGSIYLKRVRKSIQVSEGRKIEETIWASGTTFEATAIYTYDKENRGTELASFDANGKPTIRQVTIYGANGKPTEVETFHQNSLTGKIAYAYDSQGNLTEFAEHDAGGVRGNKYVFSGDLKRGSQTEMAEYDANDNLVKKESYVREFDSHGNWTKTIKSEWDKSTGKFRPVEVTQRSITYY